MHTLGELNCVPANRKITSPWPEAKFPKSRAKKIYLCTMRQLLFLTTPPRLKLMRTCAGGTFSPSRTMKRLDTLIRRGVRQMLPLGLSEKIDCRTARPPISEIYLNMLKSVLYYIHIVSYRIPSYSYSARSSQAVSYPCISRYIQN